MPSSASAATPAIYTLSLHDALPICDTSAAVLANAHLAMARLCRWSGEIANAAAHVAEVLRLVDPKSESSVHQVSLALGIQAAAMNIDRKSTRLNSSHMSISYAVFCFCCDPRDLHSFPTRRSSDL